MITRKEILEQLSAGEIDVNRAAEMLNALNSAEEEPIPLPPPPPGPPPSHSHHVHHDVPPDSHAGYRNADTDTSRRGRWLRVHITDLESGRARVRVNVPLALVNLGLKLGARFTDELDEHLIENLMAAVHDDSITGPLVEVEDMEDKERVVVFID